MIEDDKRLVKLISPDCQGQVMPYNDGNSVYWIVTSNNVPIGCSFESEDDAWHRSAQIYQTKMLEKLES